MEEKKIKTSIKRILKKLKQDQEIACKNFCDIEKLPSKEIIKIIKKEINLGYEK